MGDAGALAASPARSSTSTPKLSERSIVEKNARQNMDLAQPNSSVSEARAVDKLNQLQDHVMECNSILLNRVDKLETSFGYHSKLQDRVHLLEKALVAYD